MNKKCKGIPSCNIYCENPKTDKNGLLDIKDFGRNKNAKDGRQTRCKHCESKRNKSKWKFDVNKKHNNIKNAGQKYKLQQNGIPAVYVVSNPAWKGWYKVGKAKNVYGRFRSYNTSSPFRDYICEYVIESKNYSKLESMFHTKNKTTKGEWYKIKLEDIIKELENYEKIII